MTDGPWSKHTAKTCIRRGPERSLENCDSTAYKDAIAGLIDIVLPVIRLDFRGSRVGPWDGGRMAKCDVQLQMGQLTRSTGPTLGCRIFQRPRKRCLGSVAILDHAVFEPNLLALDRNAA